MNSAKKLMAQEKNDKKTKKASAPTSTSTLGSTGTTGMSRKAIALAVICIAVVLALCIGVAFQQFKSQTILTVGDTKLTMDDMMYPIYERESKYLPSDEMYKSYMGTSVWDASYMGDDSQVDSSLSNAEGLKKEIINAETEYEVLYQEAKKENYTLTSDEKGRAQEEAKEAMKGLSFLQKLQLSISKNKLIERFEKRIIAERYKRVKQTETDATVNDQEAIQDIDASQYREYDIQYYYFSKTTYDDNYNEVDLTEEEIAANLEKLKKLQKQSLKADDFTTLIDENEQDIKYSTAEFTEKDGWAEYLSEDNVKLVKKLKNEQISAVIEDKTAGNYMFVKMVDNNSTKSYETACDEALDNAKNIAYYNWLSQVKENYEIAVNDELWNDVQIGTVTTEIVTADDLADMAEEASSDASSN